MPRTVGGWRRAAQRLVVGGAASLCAVSFLGPVLHEEPMAPVASVRHQVRVDFFGDSLLEQARAYLLGDFRTDTADLMVSATGGTALCDFVYPQLRTTAQGLQLDTAPGPILRLTRADAPAVAVIEFSGNTLTPCIAQQTFSLALFTQNYELCLTAAVSHLHAIGTRHVILDAGPPFEVPQASQGAVRSLYEHVAHEDAGEGVRYATAADDAVSNHGRYTTYLACLKSETEVDECGNVDVDGVESDQVRSADGRHFCPVPRGSGQVPPCPVYSSGAARFASAFTSLVGASYPQVVLSTHPVVSGVAPSVGPATGGTELTVSGFRLKGVVSVRVVKLYFPVVDGVTLEDTTPIEVTLDATRVHVVSPTEVTCLSPPVNGRSAPDPGNVFVQVATARGVSVVGWVSQEFNEP